MFPVGFSGKPGARHRSAARALKDSLIKRGHTVTWGSLTAPLAADTNRLIQLIRSQASGSRVEQDIITTFSEQEGFTLSEAAHLQIMGLQDLGEPPTEHGYSLDNDIMMEAALLVRESRMRRDKGYYLRQTLSAADMSADFLIAPDVRTPHEATWFADNGICLRFIPVAQNVPYVRSLDELDGFREFYGRFKATEFQTDAFAEELEQIMEAQFAYAS